MSVIENTDYYAYYQDLLFKSHNKVNNKRLVFDCHVQNFMKSLKTNFKIKEEQTSLKSNTTKMNKERKSI